jgi:DNA polymerase I
MPGSGSIHSESRERLFLIDGMAMAYRAYFSFINRPLINSKGENTGAIYGFITTLSRILNEHPEHIAVVFDTREPTFRHLMYEPYKATREKMPEDLSAQIDRLKEVVRAFNVPSLELPGFEADDIMGTLARKAERQGIETVLVTADKDFMQLVSPLIRMYRPGKMGDDWDVVDESVVRERFGVGPSQVIDVLGLTGDKSDNVPGIRGIGDKTAIPLIQEFGTIENLIANSEAIPQKGLRERIEKEASSALLSKKLVTIDVNVPIEVDIHHLTARPKDEVKLKELYTALEFRSLLKKLDAPAPAVPVLSDTQQVSPPILPTTDIKSDRHTYHCVTTEKELAALAKKLAKSLQIVFDTETTSLDPYQTRLVGISFSLTPGEAWYVPVRPFAEDDDNPSKKVKRPAGSRTKGKTLPEPDNSTHHNDLFGTPQSSAPAGKEAIHPSHLSSFPLPLVKKYLGPVMADPAIGKVGQNAKFDVMVLTAAGLKTEGVVFDTMVASYLLRADGSHGLDAMAADHLGYKMVSYEDLTGTGKEQKSLTAVDVGAIAEYSAEDADITCRLKSHLSTRLKESGLLELGEKVEFPLVGVLASMELAGVALDLPYLAALSKEMDGILTSLTSEIYSEAGESFNINSTQQLGKILFDKLGLPPLRKTKTGYSTDAGVLEELRKAHAIIPKLLEYRQIQKLKSTYVDALPALINPVTGRIHTSFNQTVAATGRLSSSNPNLQNIPIRTELGRSIRRAFVAGSPGQSILSADYSQIELRIMAHMSGDEGLTEAFRQHEDIHTTTAARVFGIPAGDVTKEMRRKAKEVNFGIMYGIGPFGLASRLEISQSEAKGIIDTYFTRFPKVRQYITDTLAGARKNGYVITLLGRKRYFADINSRNQAVRGNAERQAINMPIQGTAADMIKLAMVAIHSKIASGKISALMLLQVHDELVFEVPTRDAEKVKKLIQREMSDAMPLSVPVEVDAGTGNNWLEAH